MATVGSRGTLRVGPRPGNAGSPPPFPVGTASRKRLSPWIWVAIATGFLFVCVVGLVGLQKLNEIEEARQLRAKYLAIFINQPDLLATFDAREGLTEIHGQYSRLGSKRFIALPVPTADQEPGSPGPTTRAVVIFDIGPTVTVVFHEFKAFAITQKSALDSKSTLEDPFLGAMGMLDDRNVTVVEIGPTRIGDYDVQVIEISDGKSAPIRAYICPALKDAIVRLEIPFEHTKDKTSSQYELSKVMLEFDKSLFQVPASYSDVSYAYRKKYLATR